MYVYKFDQASIIVKCSLPDDRVEIFMTNELAPWLFTAVILTWYLLNSSKFVNITFF